MLQVKRFEDNVAYDVSIPLKSGRCCKTYEHTGKVLQRLNPFEVREVLQGIHIAQGSIWNSLNPFEVREVLQEERRKKTRMQRGLNPFEVREVLQGQQLRLR